MYLTQPLQPSSSKIRRSQPASNVASVDDAIDLLRRPQSAASLQRRETQCKGLLQLSRFHLETPKILYEVIDRSLRRIHLHELIKSPSSRFLRRRQRPHRICRTPLLERYELQQNQKEDENQKFPGKRSAVPKHARAHPCTLQPTLTFKTNVNWCSHYWQKLKVIIAYGDPTKARTTR